ncbi:MAG: ATP-binding protein, partial [Candidatus Riflebacteria bacterium]|nr:ATP-binding protein [Candidatus Riflebacteria bacterium]
GPRQCGKTTLLKMLVEKKKLPYLWLNCDEPDMRLLLSNKTSTNLKQLVKGKKLLIIDEAQRVENIGLTLKIISDNIPDLITIASGSSSFELANTIKEPLTGRKLEFILLPFSITETINYTNTIEEKRLLDSRLIYGLYPDVYNHFDDSKDILMQLSDSYLYKDILIWEKIQKSERIEKLLQALAFQIGSQVSFNEIGQMIGLNSETVEKYVTLLERAFVIFRLPVFSRNLRNELKKTRKIYFYDNGIRNAVIKQFAPLELRNDVGALWENFCISERKKRNYFLGYDYNCYFWRTTQQQEVDYIEEADGKLSAFEFKYNPKAKAKAPLTFSRNYPNSTFSVITPDNFIEWLE